MATDPNTEKLREAQIQALWASFESLLTKQEKSPKIIQSLKAQFNKAAEKGDYNGIQKALGMHLPNSEVDRLLEEFQGAITGPDTPEESQEGKESEKGEEKTTKPTSEPTQSKQEKQSPPPKRTPEPTKQNTQNSKASPPGPKPNPPSKQPKPNTTPTKPNQATNQTNANQANTNQNQTPNAQIDPKKQQRLQNIKAIDKQFAALNANLNLPAAKRNPQVKAQILSRMQALQDKKQQLVIYNDAADKLKKLEAEFGDYDAAFQRIAGKQYDPKLSKAQRLNQRQNDLQKERNLAQSIERQKQILRQYGPNLSPEQREYIRDNITPSDELKKKLLLTQLRATGSSPADNQEVRRINQKTNTFELLGVGRYGNNYSLPTIEQNIERQYNAILNANLSPKEKQEALKKLDEIIRIRDRVGPNPSPEELKKQIEALNISRARKRAAAYNPQNIKNKYQLLPKGQKIDLGDWYQKQKDQYKDRKLQALKALGGGITTVITGAGGSVGQMGHSAYNSKLGLRIRGSKVWKFGAAIGDKGVAAGKWFGKKPNQFRNAYNNVAQKVGDKLRPIGQKLNQIDENIANRINRAFGNNLDVFDIQTPTNIRTPGLIADFDLKKTLDGLNKFQRGKKKKKSKAGFALKLAYDRFVGRIRQIYTSAKNGAYTISGLRRINTARKGLSNSLSNVKTRFMGGFVGKTMLRLQKVGNFMKATGRALGSGGRHALAAGITAVLLGANPTTALVLAGTFGAAGTGIRLINDTLASSSPSSITWIQNLQKKFGAIGHQLQNADLLAKAKAAGGVIDPRMIRSRTQSLLRALNPGLYGTTAGLLLGGLFGLSGGALLAAGVLGGVAGTGLNYAIERSTVKMLASSSGNAIRILSKMPFFEAVGFVQAAPWIQHNINELQRLGLADYLKQNWIPTSLKGISNYFHLGADIGINGFFTYKSIAALGLANTTLGTAAIGAFVGGAVGIGAAAFLGVGLGTVGTFAVAGATAGSIIGLFVGGAFGGGFGAILGTTVFSAVGSFFGSIVDKIFGNADQALKIMSGLSLIKALWDFVEALLKKFDPTAAVGFAFALIMIGSGLADLGFDQLSSNSTGSSSQGSNAYTTPANSTPKKAVAGQTIKSMDCQNQKEKIIINPERSTITKILKKGDKYEIRTQAFIFTGITEPTRLEKHQTIGKGEIVGTCRL